MLRLHLKFNTYRVGVWPLFEEKLLLISSKIDNGKPTPFLIWKPTISMDSAQRVVFNNVSPGC